MLALFSSVQSLLKQDKVHISNKVFLMHSKVTVIILSVFSILVSSRQFFGNPIDCTVHGAPAYMMETFCWIHATYTVPELMAKVIGKDASHVGISTHVEGEDEVKFHKYYQWVCFVLFFQGLLEFSFKKFFNFFDNKQKIIFKHFYHAAICFFLPRCLWKSLEGCRMKALVLSCGKELDKENQKENLFKYFEDNLKRHNVYFLRFVICEVLNFVNVIVQIKFLDFFLDGEFSTYGTEVLKFLETDTELRVDPMSRVFPTMTKCVFYQYGPSGGIKSYDGLCILPLNIINEKVFVFLWFWFNILAFVTGVSLIFRTLCFSFALRRKKLRSTFRRFSKYDVDNIAHMLSIGDWFFVHQLRKNLDNMLDDELFNYLAKKSECKNIA